jgi:hypothetical protein
MPKAVAPGAFVRPSLVSAAPARTPAAHPKNLLTIREPPYLPCHVTPPMADCSMKEEAFFSMLEDANFEPGVWPGSVYWGGKGWWKLARLALLASELGQTDLEATFVGRLKRRLTEALDDDGPLNVTTRWAYEHEWGGVIHTATLANFLTDFGAGWYNDHHFHCKADAATAHLT